MATADTTQKQSLFGALNTLAQEIGNEKTAAALVKAGDGPTPSDPGGYQGSSTHPTAKVDNNVQTASEGSRSAENKTDVKEDQGAPGVDSTSEATPGQDEQDSVQLNIGTQQSATGEDSATENDYKSDKDDPGTSHPAKTTDGEKYGSFTFKEARDRSLSLSNEILADLANGFGGQFQAPPKQAAAVQPPQQAAAVAPVQPAAPEQTLDAPLVERMAKAADAIAAGASTNGVDAQVAAGYELATALGVEKQAAQEAVAATIEGTINDAHIDADLVGSFVTTFHKRAMGEMPMDPEAEGGEDHSMPGDEESGAGGMAGLGGEELGGGGLEGLGGGGGLGGLGGEPGLEGGGGLGGEPGEEEAMQELVAALEELGIPLEELAAAEAGGGGGLEGGGLEGGLGGPPEGGLGLPPEGAGLEGLPPEGPPMEVAASHMKLAGAIHQYKRAGNYQIGRPARTKRARHIRDVMKGHLQEVMGIRA